MASFEGAKAIFGGLSYSSSSNWQRADTSVVLSNSPSSPSSGEGAGVPSTAPHDTSAQDAVLAGGVAVGLIAVMLLVYVTFCCHVMGLHHKFCGRGCRRRRGDRGSQNSEASPPAPHGGTESHDGAPSSRQVDGMIALLELSTPRLPGHMWQAGALRRQAVPVGNTPPPSYSLIYNSKDKKDHRPSPSDMHLASSEVIVLWRIIVEATEEPNSEENDDDLPVFESPVHSARSYHSQPAEGRCNSPDCLSMPVHHRSTSSVFERAVTPQTVPHLVLDDCSGRNSSQRCPDSETSYKNSPRVETSPACTVVDMDARLTTPQVSFFRGNFEECKGRIGGAATHDTGYSSCSTAESDCRRKRIEFQSSIERSYTQPRPVIRRTNLNVFTNSLCDVAKHVSESPTRLVLLKYQLTPHGRNVLNLNNKFATRSRQNGASTGSYMEIIQSKDFAMEIEKFRKISESDHKTNKLNKTREAISPSELHKSPSCTVHGFGRSPQKSPNSANSGETFGCKVDTTAKVAVVGPRLTVRVALPTGDVTSDVAASREVYDGSGRQSYVALFKAHPLYPIQACSVQVYSGSLAVSVVSIESLSSDYGVVESFVYGLVQPSDRAPVDHAVTSPMRN